MEIEHLFLLFQLLLDKFHQHIDGSIIIYGDITLFKKNKAMVSYINAEYVTENTYSFKDRKIDDAFFKVASRMVLSSHESKSNAS